MGVPRRRPLALLTRLCLCAALATAAPSCATITGIATGALTGLIDGPRQVATHYEDTYHKHPEYWAANVLIIAPLSCAFGPFFGMVKGIALDVQWLCGETRYCEAFGSLGRPSIWRPYTIHFNTTSGEVRGP
jgi:hypothetical protein